MKKQKSELFYTKYIEIKLKMSKLDIKKTKNGYIIDYEAELPKWYTG